MMTDGGPSVIRDDRAWPRHAIPTSAVLASGALALALYIATAGAGAWLTAVVFLAGAGVGATLLMLAIRSWLTGGTIPRKFVVISVVLSLVALILSLATGLVGAGGALWCGLVFGLMIGNVRAIRMARASRNVSAL